MKKDQHDIFRCLLVVSLVLCLAFGGGVYALADPAASNVSGILLSWTGSSSNSITVTWTDQVECSAYVQYVTKAEYQENGFNNCQQQIAESRTIRTTETGSYRYEAILNGLKPDTSYYYRIGSGDSWTDPASFRTATGNEENFAFAYFGDIQVEMDMLSELADWGELSGQAAASYDLAFGLLGGDIVQDGGNLSNWNAFLAQATKVFSAVPLLATNGNHESNFSSGKPESYLDTFAFPANGPAGFEEEFYSFDYGICHILVLNSHVFSGEQALTAAQYADIADWIEEDLAYSEGVWSIVLLHHPVYALAADAVSAQVEKNWAPIFEANGVDLVLEGHQHVYSRSYPLYQGQIDYTNGITYVMGNSGAKSYSSADETFSAKTIYSIPNYQIIEIDGEFLYLSTYDSTGTRLDFVSISPKPKPGRVLVGDVNRDGLINQADVAALLVAIRGNTPYAEAMDINGDAKVNVLDAHLLYLQLGGEGAAE